MKWLYLWGKISDVGLFAFQSGLRDEDWEVTIFNSKLLDTSIKIFCSKNTD
jgi:hypothetical protein